MIVSVVRHNEVVVAFLASDFLAIVGLSYSKSILYLKSITNVVVDISADEILKQIKEQTEGPTNVQKG